MPSPPGLTGGAAPCPASPQPLAAPADSPFQTKLLLCSSVPENKSVQCAHFLPRSWRHILGSCAWCCTGRQTQHPGVTARPHMALHSPPTGSRFAIYWNISLASSFQLSPWWWQLKVASLAHILQVLCEQQGVRGQPYLQFEGRFSSPGFSRSGPCLERSARLGKKGARPGRLGCWTTPQVPSFSPWIPRNRVIPGPKPIPGCARPEHEHPHSQWPSPLEIAPGRPALYTHASDNESHDFRKGVSPI